MAGKYRGKSKAEVRAIVLTNNKNRNASDKKNLSMDTEIKLWRLSNPSEKTKKPKARETTVNTNVENKNEKGGKFYGGGRGENLSRDQTYKEYVQSLGLNDDAPADDLYKPAPTTKRGYVMKRNRK
tara:strand:+ start:290 stop:667 length:378 start_codon:yes stop_codon:yes gene_type:complete